MTFTFFEPSMLAAAIFLATYALIISNRVHRTIAALAGAICMYVSGILSVTQIMEKINWEALGLIFGMFILVGALQQSGFFRWLGLTLLEKMGYSTIRIFIVFSILAAFLSAFMDSVTVMLFMSSLTIEVCTMIGMNPIPLIISEICSANIGGSATMVGDPPNVIIGTALNFTFADFVKNTGPIAVVTLLVNIVFFVVWYRKELTTTLVRNDIQRPSPAEAIKDRKAMITGIVVFTMTVIFLSLHSVIHVSIALVGLVGASIMLLIGGKNMPEVIERIDWLTLIFFAGLFVLVGGLEETGALDFIASSIAKIGNGPAAVVMLILWTSAISSAFVDNVPLAASMVPIIKSLSSNTLLGAPLPALAWALAIGTDIGGNATPIGASANVVGLSIAERNGFIITWKYYCKVGFASMLLSVGVAGLMIYFSYLR